MRSPSGPDAHPTWAPARKDMVGTSLGSSRLWFTIAEGIVTEVYYPRIDIPQIKDLGFIVADDRGFWVELRRLGNYTVATPRPGIPAVQIVHRHPRFAFTLDVWPSGRRDVLLLRYRLDGDQSLRAYALLAPRLGGDADNNLAAVAKHNGRTVLFAEQGPFGLALAAASGEGCDAWGRCSAGYLEGSDGWQDFHRNGRMTWQFDGAGPGCVTLTGELPREATLALGFASSKEAAATLALASLMDKVSAERDSHSDDWETWLASCRRLKLRSDLDHMLALSAAVLKVHEDKTYRGAIVASLSIPWGDTSQSRGGYHLVWPRDLVETAGAFVAIEAYHSARDVMSYLIATQQEDGHWYQNQWLGGNPFWIGVQLDETAFPVLLASLLRERGALDDIPVRDMIARALRFIACEGPTTSQDRWEEDAGINTFTLAVAIAALVEGSEFLEGDAKAFALRLADCWNAAIEDWAFVRDTALARQFGVSGYYIRTVPVESLAHNCSPSEPVLIKNLAHDPELPANAQLSTDFLQLVRYGLRTADDPHIVETVKAVDSLLRTETPSGPVWHRYNNDGYGEHADGSAFDGTGQGRGWPLLVGERGHYALATGEDALPYLETMMAMASPLGLIPEQVWDSAAIPDRGLEPGRPSGSAMPLVWAHAEFIKLCYSCEAGRPVDRPAATWARYRGRRPELDYDLWGPNAHPACLRAGKSLWIVLKAPARVHWGINGWKEIRDLDTRDTGLGLHAVELPVAKLQAGDSIQFTFLWHDSQSWEGKDYAVSIRG
ncbi:MAG TPA: glycoside hydrolase family 15 protein [Rhizomicrobium sp.]|jgi:glucoamylase|nr:glycoside hydrolase family 15 protein [Rhizomicrobium sp.]